MFIFALSLVKRTFKNETILQNEDKQLLKGCKKGDQKAQAQLYNKYKGILFGVCLRYSKNREDAKDLLQEGFVNIFKDLYQYQPTSALGAWMRKVMVNTALQHIRKQKRLFPTVELSEYTDAIESEEQLFSRFREKALIQMIQKLPDGYRAVFNLYVIEGYSHKEIAEQLGIAEASSKSQLSRAKQVLRRMLEKVVDS